MKYKIRINRKKYEIYDGFGHKWQVGKDPEIMAPRVFIEKMNEPALFMDDNFRCTFVFDPVPPKVAEEMVRENKVRMQVIRHRANSRHSPVGKYFPYSFMRPIYQYDGHRNECYGLAIMNNGSKSHPTNLISKPTYEELVSGQLIRDLSGIKNDTRPPYISDHCQTHSEDLWDDFYQEFYIGFIYWDSFNETPKLFKMAYWAIKVW